MESYWAHGIADHEMGPENGRWWFWRTWMLVVDPHVCGKKVVGFHLFCWIMVQIHGQNSIVCDSVQYCSECVFVKNPLAHCFRAVWVYRLKVYIYVWTLPAPMVSYSKQPAFGSIGAAQSVPDAPEIVEPHAMGSDASCHGASVDRWFYGILWFRMKQHELLGGLEHGSYDFPYQPPTSEKSILIWWWILRQFRWNSAGGTKDPTPHNSSIAGAAPGDDARASMGWYFRC